MLKTNGSEKLLNSLEKPKSGIRGGLQKQFRVSKELNTSLINYYPWHDYYWRSHHMLSMQVIAN